MCTSIKFKECMGRNFDYEISYKEAPRWYEKEKYTIFGMATDLVKEYPLYYDAMNTEGLCIAALNFEGNAHYNQPIKDKNNIAPWELPIKLLGNCKNVEEVKGYLKNVNIIDKDYSDTMPNSPLHWFVCDLKGSITIEQTKDGLNVYDNFYNVLTNNPPFDKMEKTVNRERGLFHKMNGLYEKIIPRAYKTRGVETYGLLGDLTSVSRFERVLYFKDKLLNTKNNFTSFSQTFHLLDSVKQIYGATPVDDKFEYTIYEVVYDMNKLNMYIKFYNKMDSIAIIDKNGKWVIR